MDLTFADWIIIALYFALILFIGFVLARSKEKNRKSKEEFLLAGRKVTLPLFVATLVATWYGSILGIGEFVYRSGIVAWICFGIPYYIAAALFAWFISSRIRNGGAATIPEQIELSYGRAASKISSIIVLIITIPAAYMLMLGVMLRMFTGWNLALSVVLGTAASMAYLYSGGLKADILTNTAQFIFMYVGFGALLVFCLIGYGEPGLMLAKLPTGHMTLLGGKSWQYVLSWYIIAFQTFVDPSFHQRCAAAKNSRIAKNGVLVSIIFWMVFDFLTLTTGLYAKAFISVGDPMMSYPALANAVLPIVWKGVFVVALLATVMSTLDSYAFISAATIGNDLIYPAFRKKIPHNITIKIGLIITSIVGVIMAVLIPSAIDLIYKTSSVAVPALIVPLTISYTRRLTLERRNAMLIMVASAFTSGVWVFFSYMGFYRHFAVWPIFTQVEPMMPGILVAILLSICFVKKNNTEVSL